MWLSPIVADPWLQDAIALVASTVLALAFLKLNDWAARRRVLPEYITRKLVHTATGPLFLLCWPLYSLTWHARWAAAAVPGGLTALFVLIGLGVVHKDDFVAAMSRSGDPRELLRGPLLYGIAFVTLTLLFWTSSPTGIVALMLLCGGDGLADIVGRRWGLARLPGRRAKTWAGSLAFLGGGTLLALAYVAFFAALGFYPLGPGRGWQPVLGAAALATLVEAYTPSDLDNLTVPLSAILFLLLIPGRLAG